jgi:uncharacterized protein DUF1573
LITLLLLALALASCGDQAAPVPGPRLALAERSFDAGRLEPAAELGHTFALRNDGGRPLRLAPLRSGCGCRAIASPSEVVAPGASGSIDLVCDVGDVAGPLRRTVTVYTNDATQPSVTLELAADVAADVAPLQPEFYFGRAGRGQRTARDLRLRVRDEAAAPRRASSEAGFFVATVERRAADDWRIALTVAPQTPAGVVRDRVVVETGSRSRPRLVVPVVGTVVEGSAGMPDEEERK